VRIDGDYLTRLPAEIVEELLFDIVKHSRLQLGILERLVARKPS
jgi:hypothetical protein